MTEKKEKKGCCCCKKKPVAKKRKATVGKGQKTAKQIVNAPMPMMRPTYEPFLYGGHAEGERQRFLPKNEVTIPTGEFVKEHVSLVNILKSGTKTEQKKEAASQEKELTSLLKPDKYQRNKPTEAKPQKVLETAEPPARNNLTQIKAMMKKEKEPYNVILGGNVPIKREGQYIKKETGLFAPEVRGAPTKEEKMMEQMKGQTKLDKFFKTPE